MEALYQCVFSRPLRKPALVEEQVMNSCSCYRSETTDSCHHHGPKVSKNPSPSGSAKAAVVMDSGLKHFDFI